MRKYTIQFDYSTVVELEILAESEEEARQKAGNEDFSLDEHESTLNYEEVTKVEDVPDLEILIQQARDIVKTAGVFLLNPWAIITIRKNDGTSIHSYKETVNRVVWNKKRGDIGFDGGHIIKEIILSELSEIEQFHIAKKIVEQSQKQEL